jgi:hypothetical protein
MEVSLKTKDGSSSKKASNTQKRDLRNGIHGSLTINSVDAELVVPVVEDKENLATPDFSVPEGQTTHE